MTALTTRADDRAASLAAAHAAGRVDDGFLGRFDDQFPRLHDLFTRLYGDRPDGQEQLAATIAAASLSWNARPLELKVRDAQRAADPHWFASERMLGGVAYVDRFGGNLAGIRDQIPYFRELGLTSLHLMPLFARPAEHNDGGYAATAYGVQGATVTTSHTILSDTTSAAGVYVGMTRGCETNQLHVVAENMTDARTQFVEAFERDRADRGLAHATQQALEAVRGLVAEGPIKLVTEELARLDQEAEHALREAERWEQIAARFDAQRAAHRTEDDENTAVLSRAKATAEHVRAEVTEPLTRQAVMNGAAYLTVIEAEKATRERVRYRRPVRQAQSPCRAPGCD